MECLYCGVPKGAVHKGACPEPYRSDFTVFSKLVIDWKRGYDSRSRAHAIAPAHPVSRLGFDRAAAPIPPRLSVVA